MRKPRARTAIIVSNGGSMTPKWRMPATPEISTQRLSISLAAVLPGWLAATFQWMYLVSGLLMLLGLLFGSFAIEGMGLVFLATVVAVREIVFVYYLGFTPNALVSAVFYVSVWWACAARFATLRRGETIARIRPARED